MIRLNNIHLTLGGQVIFDGVSWQTKENDRVGLVGANGSGKTTLLKMITGEIAPDQGQVIAPARTRIGLMPQEPVQLEGRTVYSEVLSVFSEALDVQERTREIEELLADEEPGSRESERLLGEYGRLQDKMVTLEGYQIEARIGEVLAGLGFSQSDRDRPVEEFSGGWQMRLLLAKLLLSGPSVLLLDEPTNHLDLEARNWLEDYLQDYPGAIILVSHDRYFLETVTSRITEVEHGSLTDYHSSYAGYRVEKEARYEQLVARAKRQEEKIRRTQMFINKFRYDKRRAAQAQSRAKMLEKIEIIKVPPRPRKIHFHFPDPPRSGRIVLELEGVRKSYGANEVFKELDLIVERGDRIGLVGPNGAGKSTLMRMLAGSEPYDRGSIRRGHNVHFHFMDQDITASLGMDNIVLDELQNAAPFDIRAQVRNLLGAFLFSGDDVQKKVSVLSGGEKSRLAIARMLLTPSNLLLLDEPTNHLDILSQEILLNALERFTGTVVFVSHERYFINKLAKKIVKIDGGRLTIYPGNYEDFLARKAANGKGHVTEAEAPPEKRDKEAAIRERERRRSAVREERKKARRLEELEKTIHETEARLRDLETSLSDPDLYKEGQAARELVTKHRALKAELEELYDRWVGLGG